jgi:c-di-GMP-binding flagellar brake protein YcgR
MEEAVFTEQRKSARKVLKVRALLATDSQETMIGRTADVSAHGVSVTLPAPLQPGQACQVSFDVFVDGKLTTIKTRSKALYCVLSNGEFKVGFQFVNLDLSAMTALARFLR